ncbi:sigma-70 family RNA polymerase sigma factor [Anaerolineales bacterium]
MANSEFEEDLTVQLAQSGDLDAFNQLVLIYQDMIYSIAYRLMGSPDLAEDMTQETFILAFRKLDSYQGGSFKSWLGRIVSNRCYDELRKYQRRPAVSIEEMPGADTDDGFTFPDASITPEESAQQNELNQAIQDCINSLSPNQRLVMVLSDLQGLNYQEIADHQELSLGTVKSRLSRARAGVRDCLQGVKELLPAVYRQ